MPVLGPALYLWSKLPILASFLQPEDAGMELCLAKKVSHAATFFRKLMPIPEPHMRHCGFEVRCWEGNNSTKPKQFVPQYRVWHPPRPWDRGHPCQGHFDPLPKPICLSPHTQSFTAVTRKSWKSIEKMMGEQQTGHSPCNQPASTLTFSVSPCCCLPGSGRVHLGFLEGNLRG